MLLLLNEHGDPSFLFQNLSSYNTNNQYAKFDKTPSVGSQWNDLKCFQLKNKVGNPHFYHQIYCSQHAKIHFFYRVQICG